MKEKYDVELKKLGKNYNYSEKSINEPYFDKKNIWDYPKQNYSSKIGWFSDLVLIILKFLSSEFGANLYEKEEMFDEYPCHTLNEKTMERMFISYLISELPPLINS